MKKIIIVLLTLLLTACSQAVPANTTNSTQPQKDNPTETKEDEEVKNGNEKYFTYQEYSSIYIVASSSGSKESELKEITFTINKLPSNLEELKEIERTGEIGAYIVFFELLAAYETWEPNATKDCENMMKELLNSPTVKNGYTNNTRSFVKERMEQNEKWKYIADSYFLGATSQNKYTPSEPLKLTVRESPYGNDKSNLYSRELSIKRIAIDMEDGLSERYISVYQDPTDNKWYIWSDTYGGLLADIKIPE